MPIFKEYWPAMTAPIHAILTFQKDFVYGKPILPVVAFPFILSTEPTSLLMEAAGYRPTHHGTIGTMATWGGDRIIC